jgi:SAM-dependent methyltransferase
MSADPYERLAEFHDLFMDDAWERLSPVLGAAFGALGSSSLVVDLGAGTGVGTRALARATSARILAVEPSLVMRTVLTARVADDPALTSRISISPVPAPGVLDELTAPLAGFVCAHMLGHLGIRDRSATFAGLARCTADDVVGVVVVDPDPVADGVEDHADADDHAVTERRIGDLRYVERHLPAGSDRFSSEYTVYDGDRPVRREWFEGSWQTVTLDDLAAEMAPHGFGIEPRMPGVGIVLRR